MEFLRRIKRSYVRPSQVFPQKYTEFLCIGALRVAHIWHTYSLLSHNFSIIKTYTSILFFLKRVRPDSLDRAGWPGTLWIQNPPLLMSYYKNTNFFFGEWPILCTPTSKEPSRDHQGQVSIIATRRSSTVGNDPQGPRSATRGGVGTAVL
jgi:hypothetical protein